MKLLFSFLFIALTQFACAQKSTSKSLDFDLEEIKGTWVIDLRPSPGSAAHVQEFTIEPKEGNQFSGTFYGSEFKDGYFNLEWEVLYFGFSSRDGSSGYYHSGYIKDGKIHGVTYCPGREFTIPWVGEKKE